MHRRKNLLWDLWCAVSIVGIWPRFIEPRCLSITKKKLPIARLPTALEGLKILQFSDLHWGNHSQFFVDKLTRKINHLSPDIILFTGDFINRSRLTQADQLHQFLCSLKARLGCFAILGNHDYQHFVTLSAKGDYDIDSSIEHSDVSKGFKRLFCSSKDFKMQISLAARQVNYHEELLKLLAQTPFVLLNNTTTLIEDRGEKLNICGLEEYTLGRFNREEAFRNYREEYPGLILTHNPDTIPQLLDMPGDLILAGHTHGGEINLPGIWQKFTYMKYPQFKRGLKKIGSKWIYINRGIGGVPFRLFAMPEISLFTLRKGEM